MFVTYRWLNHHDRVWVNPLDEAPTRAAQRLHRTNLNFVVVTPLCLALALIAYAAQPLMVKMGATPYVAHLNFVLIAWGLGIIGALIELIVCAVRIQDRKLLDGYLLTGQACLSGTDILRALEAMLYTSCRMSLHEWLRYRGPHQQTIARYVTQAVPHQRVIDKAQPQVMINWEAMAAHKAIVALAADAVRELVGKPVPTR